MVNNKFHLTFLFLFFVIISILHAQTPEASQEADFYIERRFIQVLSWSGSEQAVRYEIIIEKEEGRRFERVFQEFSEENKIEVSLSPGKYRYRVIPYDIIRRQGTGTEWIDFEIFAAVHPTLYFSVPEAYLSGAERPVFSGHYVLVIYGENISPHGEIFLRRENGTIIKSDNMQISSDRKEARVTFNDLNLIPRNFDVVVRNPGDLEASLRTRSYVTSPPDRAEAHALFDELGIMPQSLRAFLRVPPPREEVVEEETEPPVPKYDGVDIHLTIGYSPVFSTFDYIALLPENVMALPSAVLKFGFIYTPENSYFGFGLEADASLFSLNIMSSSEGIDQYSNVSALMLDINLLIQKLMFSENAAFRFKFGAGFDTFVGGSPAPAPFHINVGASFVWFLRKHFCMETGIDMIYWTTDNNASGAVRPHVSVGVRF